MHVAAVLGETTKGRLHTIRLMVRAHNYYVYMMASLSGTLYVGVTNDLERRVSEHRFGAADGFTRRYLCTRLVWFEHSHDITAAIAREKQIKGWRRDRKVALIEAQNPGWEDLAQLLLSS